MICPKCGTEFEEGIFCPECGTKVEIASEPVVEEAQNVAPVIEPEPKVESVTAVPTVEPLMSENNGPSYAATPQYTEASVSYDPSWPKRSKLAAALLAIFLGGLGIHKFYLGKIVWGIVYLLFAWTFISELVGFIEGIVYLCMSDERFQEKYHVRLR